MESVKLSDTKFSELDKKIEKMKLEGWKVSEKFTLTFGATTHHVNMTREGPKQ
jgi:hypothetical protein